MLKQIQFDWSRFRSNRIFKKGSFNNPFNLVEESGNKRANLKVTVHGLDSFLPSYQVDTTFSFVINGLCNNHYCMTPLRYSCFLNATISVKTDVTSACVVEIEWI